MKKKRSLILRLLPWLIILAAIAALIVFVFVPIYSQQETSFGADPVVYEYEGKNDPLKMETDRLLFEMDPATTQFALTDKKTGKVWNSNPADRGQIYSLTSDNQHPIWYHTSWSRCCRYVLPNQHHSCSSYRLW